MISFRAFSFCVLVNVVLHVLQVTSVPVKSFAQKSAGGNKKSQKGLDIDLNLPPPVEKVKKSKQIKTAQEMKEFRKIYYARQGAKRKERRRTDPQYARGRREIEIRAKEKWSKKLADAHGGDKEAAIQQIKTYQHARYLDRRIKYGGHPSKKEQEVAETLKKMSKGETVPEEDQRVALEHRKKRSEIQKASALRIKERRAQAQAQEQEQVGSPDM